MVLQQQQLEQQQRALTPPTVSHIGGPIPPPPSMAAVPSKFRPVEVIEEGKRKPYLYETAYDVLKEDGSSMYYKEVAARINAMGIPTTGDQVLGALGGWYAHAGSEYLERTGPGRFRARPGKVFVPSTGTREINAVMIVKPPSVPVTTNANGEQEPMVQIGQAYFSRAFLHQMSVSKAPFYQLACEILREALVPMHYREIASVLKASGRNVHQDTIMGSLNGFINTPVGKAQLQRVGKGIYTLCDFVRVDQRTASIMPPPPLQRPPRSVSMEMGSPEGLMPGGPMPPSVVLLPSGSKRGRESDEEDEIVNELNRIGVAEVEEDENVAEVHQPPSFLSVASSATIGNSGSNNNSSIVSSNNMNNSSISSNNTNNKNNINDSFSNSNNNNVNSMSNASNSSNQADNKELLLNHEPEEDQQLHEDEVVAASPIDATGGGFEEDQFGVDSMAMDESGDHEEEELLFEEEGVDELAPPSKRAHKDGESEIPTFLEVYFLFKSRATIPSVPGAPPQPGLTLKELADALAERGTIITTQRLNSRLSAYTSYRRKKNLPQLFDRKHGKFTLSVYGRRLMNDYHLEADFVNSVSLRTKPSTDDWLAQFRDGV